MPALPPLTAMSKEAELHQLAARLGREVVVEDHGVYLLSRGGSDDERIGGTPEAARRALIRRVQRRQAAMADRYGQAN
ncbi:hypothetical protein GCM10011315_43740 [Roseovarius pacificus]|nr:hypothetical protein GCM10011315_43740 [Roseovarius pacificus]